MAKNSIHRQVERSPEEKARDKAIRDELRNRPTPEELVASGEYAEPIPQGVVLDAMMLLAQLREAREAADLTLATLAERTGIDKPALSRLETGRQSNPTLQTILRYAHGLGKRIVWSIVDDAEETVPAEESVPAVSSAEAEADSRPPMEDAEKQHAAKAFVEYLLVTQARIAASLAEGYKEPTRFMFEQTSGRGTRFGVEDWLRPEIQNRLTPFVHEPLPSHSPLLTLDWEGRLAFLCSPVSITQFLPQSAMRDVLILIWRKYKTQFAEGFSEDPEADKIT